MKILALEFSSPQRSVAVLNPEAGTVAEVVDTATGHATKPFTMIEAALREAGLEREQIECVAVGLGPGSYNGIRAAIALAQGWQLAREVKLLGLSSAACVAAQAAAIGLVGQFNVVIDAQRGEFYLAEYEMSGNKMQEVSALRILSAEAVRERQGRGEKLIGPEVARWFAGGHQILPRAETLARQARERTVFVRGEELEPIYLRPPNFVKAPPPRVIPY